MTTFTISDLTDARDQLMGLQQSFSESFAVNTKKSFTRAKEQLSEAVEIVDNLSDDDENFPTGLTSLPTDLRRETSLDYVLSVFDSIIEEIDGAIAGIEERNGNANITLRLVDCDGNELHFKGALNPHSTEFELERIPEDEGKEPGDHTTLADFSCEYTLVAQDKKYLAINGTAWRDLESSEKLAEFLTLAFFSESDPQEFLDNLATELGETTSGTVVDLTSPSTELTLLSTVLENQCLTDEQVEQIARLKWHVWQNNSDYTDLEFEIVYEEKKGSEEDKSINLHFTFNWQERYAYMMLGTNLGDGFNECHQVKLRLFSLTAALDSFISGLLATKNDDAFLSLINDHPDAWNGIREGAGKLSEWLRLPR